VYKAQPPIVELADWFRSDSGIYTLDWEQARFNTIVADVFGYNALQIGLPELDLLKNNRIAFKSYALSAKSGFLADEAAGAIVLAQPECLPFASQSVDLLLLPHGLETSPNPHQVLREAERVLVPEGRVVISGFNPWSLWGLRHRLPFVSPWLPQAQGGLLPLAAVKDWLKLLSFDIDRGHFGCYVPPCPNQKWIERFAFMEHAGDRWWPVCGAVYVVSAIKRVSGMRLLTPDRKTARQARRRAAVCGVAASRTHPLAEGQDSSN
jgi:SAM-dependent methyltransferase